MKTLFFLLAALPLFAAPKFFPYCVPLPESEPIVRRLGYDGIEPEFKCYRTFDFGKEESPEKLLAEIEDVKNTNAVFELVLNGFRDGDPVGFESCVGLLKQTAKTAERRGVRLALYHHTGSAHESLQTTLRLVNAVDSPNLGYAFVLCHWLKLNGKTNPNGYLPLLKAHPEKLFLVHINGAKTTGDSWQELIQPLDSGDFDNAPLLRTLTEIGYCGPVGLQCYGIKFPPAEHLARSMRVWRDLTNTLSTPAKGQP